MTVKGFAAPPKCGATPKDAEQDPLFRALLKPGFGRVFFGTPFGKWNTWTCAAVLSNTG